MEYKSDKEYNLSIERKPAVNLPMMHEDVAFDRTKKDKYDEHQTPNDIVSEEIAIDEIKIEVNDAMYSTNELCEVNLKDPLKRAEIEVKKKRGSNYTPAEKEILLKLIRKYQSIIESKETNAHMILKKRQIWDSVCHQYNAVAVSGIRTWQQLRHLYENIKQRSKKNNKKIHRTGGGAHKSIHTEQDAQTLAVIAPQVTQLQNPYDNAAVYIGDTEITNINRHSEMDAPSYLLIDHVDNIGRMKKKNKVTNTKQEYFRRKLRNAQLEHKHLINKHKMEVNKYKLEMEILKLRLHKLKSSSRKPN